MSEPMLDDTIGNTAFSDLVERASAIMRRDGARSALDRFSVSVYEQIEAAVADDPDLLELVRDVDAPQAMALIIGWMLGHGGATAMEPEARQTATFRAIVLASVAAGWSVELNHRSVKRHIS